MAIKQQIHQLLQDILKEMDIQDVTINVSESNDSSHGEYTSNIAMTIAKKIGKSPMEVAEEIKKESLTKLGIGNMIEQIEVVKPGFINFFLKKDVLGKRVKDIVSNKLEFNDGTPKKTYIIEYSSPNIAKPFTVGHLRSTIIGDAVANLLEATGNKVYRDNHIGDWGTQFGKQIVAIKKWGNEEDIEHADNPVRELVALYVKFHEESEKDPSLEDDARLWFKKLEDGDQEARTLWQKCIDWSWKEFDRIYEELGISFTENNGRGYGESYFEDKMQPTIDALESKRLLQEGKEGAKLVFFSEDTFPPLMIVKKDGATLYATRDLATDYFRFHKYGKDIVIINEVGIEQSLYFQQLYKIEEMLGWFNRDQRIHIKHGLYRFKESKMATRKGNVIWLEDVLNEAEQKAYDLQFQIDTTISREIKQKVQKAMSPSKGGGEIIKQLAKQVGIGALKWNDLKRTPEQDIVFDWNDILNMQGNSGPYLQYTYVRCQSILRKADYSKEQIFNIGQDVDFDTYTFSREEFEILRTISYFGEIVIQAAEQFQPHILCTYLFTLAQKFNLFYQKQQILKAEKKELDLRLLLVLATGKVIKDGLQLLGIETPEKM